ncbi:MULTISPECIES: helix-turn-helix domain-containing protein [Paenibacillus]|jgi:transcriptional regulator with XRE-family HTH domain|uniref:helix-turn-helix domain-containing protein n=1 Tax=Paenibacillus TaxID=44249 RepID=UPI00096D1223|nr:helix-turn-helix transcriptional regulator [Paenibacillus odorifer]OMD18022.1 transcriptional regulator [Paenibacillus odorifer]OMD75982.1 transcriptional regulator [Paenibacillus odorifer]OMD87962.1 transcriptional regulator [Paenibacillus odorifer]
MTKLRNLVGDRVRDIRKSKGLTQQKLAELSNLDDAYIGSVERGERNFSIDSLEKIVIALKVQPSEFFQNYDKQNEVEAAQQAAVDEYMVAVSGLSIKQIEAMMRIVKEVSGVLK